MKTRGSLSSKPDTRFIPKNPATTMEKESDTVLMLSPRFIRAILFRVLSSDIANTARLD